MVSFVGAGLIAIAYFFLLNEKTIYRLIPSEVDFALAPSITGGDYSEQLWEQLAKQHRLTKREREVLLLFARGRSYGRIEKELFIAQSTVNYHITNAYRKLGITNRQELLDLIESGSFNGL
ncbi:MAG: helix-turn-helix transcriptional regulator [Coriobacteriaceae bacterium]|nr:helix-turn-helix transcriptional regulator [Coriobacteriaceae bacterium]